MDEVETLRAQLAERDKRIAELRAELSEERKLIGELREWIQERKEWAERLDEGWEITRTDHGQIISEQGWNIAREYIAKYNELAKRWNRHAIMVQPVGRPIQASAAQETQVVKLRRKGASLRAIAAETSLGLKTVRTIIAHAERTDRGTQRRAAVLRVDVARQPLVRLEARRKTRDIVRRQMVELNERAKQLLKE